MFEGHQFIKLCDGKWVFDITEFRGYKVDVNKHGIVEKATLAYIVVEKDDKLAFNKLINVPVMVLKETKAVIADYKVSAFV